MTKINDGGRVEPAFRQARADDYRVKNMLLRDYFAGQAVAGWLASFRPDDAVRTSGIAKLAYEIADAMLAARSGGQDDA